MPEYSFSIPEQYLNGFTLLIDLGRDGLNRLLASLENTGPVVTSPQSRAKLIVEDSGGLASEADIAELLENAVYLMVYFRATNDDTSVDDVYDHLTEALKQSESQLPLGYVAKWAALREQVLRLLDLHTLRVEQKARSLLLERPNRTLGLDLFTDVRPVFDRSGTKVDAFALCNTLAIHFSNQDGDETSIHLSLDPEDLDALTNLIERARTKNSTIEEQNSRCEIPTVTYISTIE